MRATKATGEAPEPGRTAEVWRLCIARRVGACGLVAGCRACGSIEQSLLAAGWVLARWPQIKDCGKP